MEKLTLKAKSFAASIILASLVFDVLVAASFIRHWGNVNYLAVDISYALFVALIAFFIFKTGRVAGMRALFFIVMAASFIIVYKIGLLRQSGNLFFFKPQQGSLIEVPYCHIALAPTFFNFLKGQALALSQNWSMWGFYTMGFLWLGVTLLVGQGFCAWGCWYGGIDEFFARLPKKQLWKLNDIPLRVRLIPLGLLLFLLLASFTTSRPIFCWWICPVKMTTAYLDIDSYIKQIQLVIFLIMAFGFLIILPLLTKKRTFCSFVCPFGAWQSIVGQVNPYRVSIFKEKCVKCMKCMNVCPMLAISKESLEKGEILSSCTRCGACVDVCPTDAMDYSLLGRQFPKTQGVVGEIFDARAFFIVGALILGGVIALQFVPKAAIELMGVIQSGVH